MGLDAQVIAIGPFSKSVVAAMEYRPEYYSDVSDGQTVVSNVFVAATSAESHALAAAFGVGAMELGKHHLNVLAADLQKLEALFGESAFRKFLLLRDYGFNFYYLPNA
jgi:hypothetical protein